MVFYSFYTLTVVATLVVTCHALCKCPESSGLLKIFGMAGKGGLKEQPQLSVLPCSVDNKMRNVFGNLEHRISRLEGGNLSHFNFSPYNQFSVSIYSITTCGREIPLENSTASQNSIFCFKAVLALNGKIKEVGEKLFSSNGKEVNFASALESCEKAGGTLATPANEEENEAVLGFVKHYNRYAYLGIKESENVGQFKSINDTPLNYTNWHKYEPSGKGTERCVEMYTDGTWNDKKCNANRLTICEF